MDAALCEAARSTLTHRSGTEIEDLWIVSRKDPKTKLNITGGSLEVKPTRRLLKALTQAPAETYIGIHNHPTNIPPTGSDLAAAAARKYAFGIVASHDGSVYYYRPIAPAISARYVDAIIDKYARRGYNKTESAINALNELAREGEIEWRELK